MAAGVMIGATVGSRVLGKIENKSIRKAFVLVILFVAVQMLIKGIWR